MAAARRDCASVIGRGVAFDSRYSGTSTGRVEEDLHCKQLLASAFSI